MTPSQPRRATVRPGATHPAPVFLCERCGYDLSGTATTCPECGSPASESLPERRVGSPYQHAPSLRTLRQTWTRALVDRPALFRELRVDATHAGRLARASVCTAAACVLIGVIALSVAYLPIVSHGTLVRYTAFSVIACAGLVPILLMLTRFESMGVRFFGSRRGWRVTKPLAWTVVAHGTVGWVIAGFSLGLGLVSLAVGNTVGGLLVGTAWGNAAPWGVKVGSAMLGLCAGVGVTGGFLFFEWFAYSGMRACRYANPPDAAVPSESVDQAVDTRSGGGSD